MKDAGIILDMEESLSKDADGRYLRELKAEFQAHGAELFRKMEEGMSREDAIRHQDLKASMDMAGAILEMVWQSMHNRS